MEAPKKIYLQVCGDCPINDCEDCKFEEDNVTWCKDRIFDNDVEYTRTDAFIEKARKWFKSHGSFTIGFDGATVRDFLNFINE